MTATYWNGQTDVKAHAAFKAYNAAFRAEREALTASNNGTGTNAAFFAAAAETQKAHAAWKRARALDNEAWALAVAEAEAA